MASLTPILARFRELYRESVVRHPFASLDEISNRWGTEPDLQGRIGKALTSAVARSTASDFGPDQILQAKRALIFEEEIGQDSDDLRRAVHTVWHYTGTRPLVALGDPAWEVAIDLARALVRLGVEPTVHWDDRAPCESAKRMTQAGFKLSVLEGHYIFEDGEIERATAMCQKALDQIGLLAAVHRVIGLACRREPTNFGMVLIGRKSTMTQRAPVIPYGFLLNLGLRAPHIPEPHNADDHFITAATMAQELVAVLDVETYWLPAGLMVSPARIESVLRKAAQYDHLVGIKQWPVVLVESYLSDFFKTCQVSATEMRTKLGWTIDDAIQLWCFVAPQILKPAPWVTTREDLAHSGLAPDVLTKLLAALTHPPGTVNANYRSPIDAVSEMKSGQLAFLRPFVALDEQALLIPLPSAAGVAFYEAVIGAIRTVSKLAAEMLLGAGTEAIVLGGLRRAGFPEPIFNARYELHDPPAAGEFDVLVETPNVLIIFECKAKAPTRATMSGMSAEALLDYAAAVLDSQVQALRHENLLRKRSTIELVDGRCVSWMGQKIIRISVTLLDHGALQDPLTVGSITRALLNARIDPVRGYEKAKKVENIEKKNQELRAETLALVELGVPAREHQFSTFSFSAGQLSVFLIESTGPEDFVQRISTNTVFGFQHPLLEYLERKRIGLAPPVAKRPDPQRTA
jgi:hypothetical protein